MVKPIGIVCSILTALFFYTAQAPAAEKIVIAIQPTSTPEKLSSQAKELESFLEAKLGTDVQILFPTSYAGVVEALRFGHAHAAFMGAWPAALAQAHAGAEVVLAEVREVIVEGKKVEAPFYFSYWVTLKDSPWQSLADFRGKRAAFSSPLSTSGYVAPLSKLVDLGYVPSGTERPAEPKDFFLEALFSGGYAQAWEALKGGQADVSVIAGDVPEKLYQEVLEATRVLETQGPIPSHAVVFAKDLKSPMRENLLEALLELGEPAHRELMRKFVSGIFVNFKRAGNEHLDSLNAMLEKTGLRYEEKI